MVRSKQMVTGRPIMDVKDCSRMLTCQTGAPRHAAPLIFSRPDGCRPAPLLLAVAILLAVALGGCGKSPEEVKAAAAVHEAQTTGRLIVKSNRANATVEATLIPPSGEAAAGVVPGTVDQVLSALPPGRYAVVARAEGWPEVRGEATVVVGQTAELGLTFKGGSLRLDSIPSGATVKQGGAVLGKTPLVVAELPPGECRLSLEYPAWPVLAFTTTITESVESAETVRLPHGKLVVTSTPSGATVLLGKRPLGQTPLTLEPFPAGTRTLTLQAKNFPPLETSVALSDRGELNISPELGAGFPPLDPPALLRAVWVPDDPNRLSPNFDSSGRYAPQNGFVKNLHRQRLYDNWLGKRFRFAAVVKAYDRKEGQIEFAEQSGDLAKYRVLAKLSPEARSGKEPDPAQIKGATLAVYGVLSAVEESRWPARQISLEISSAELLQAVPPAVP